ncbi:MAG: response regulator transcription factor [Chloroflexi bacterium AL-W]|nr:response regulator transcription factor [Chloroflexi bacterium AL-N1]NOK69719.1 response regulator transcription factor [Chloroflexi bacterium AL-N10]NOK73677.1 response regulator transcription factor [Chloroflexi bacterium AL-N5]NOK83889.1 response regulator transcription factor [Chloroflexi bacterium AL-W]NOK88008.1 response regulator transcription factor [Chloroflexi bacterium AL-N15]
MVDRSMGSQRDVGKQPCILLVEDDPATVQMLSLGMRYAGFKLVVATTGLEGLQATHDCNPDLILLDWMLPGMDGLALCRRLRKMGDTPIIMLTARDEIDDRVHGLDAGADDYLVKPFHFDELAARMRARLRHNLPSDHTLCFADLTLDMKLHEAIRTGKHIALTATEFNVLLLFLRHPRQVLTKELILETVWGYDFGGSANIVEQYVRSLRQKIGEPVLIQTVRGVGYVLRELP